MRVERLEYLNTRSYVMGEGNKLCLEPVGKGVCWKF